MPTSTVMRFNCPNCDALYDLVRTEAPPTADKEIVCLCCGGPLQSCEGSFVLKYLLVRPARRARTRRAVG